NWRPTASGCSSWRRPATTRRRRPASGSDSRRFKSISSRPSSSPRTQPTRGALPTCGHSCPRLENATPTLARNAGWATRSWRQTAARVPRPRSKPTVRAPRRASHGRRSRLSNDDWRRLPRHRSPAAGHARLDALCATTLYLAWLWFLFRDDNGLAPRRSILLRFREYRGLNDDENRTATRTADERAGPAPVCLV